MEHYRWVLQRLRKKPGWGRDPNPSMLKRLFIGHLYMEMDLTLGEFFHGSVSADELGFPRFDFEHQCLRLEWKKKSIH
ncbi:hypothetical protein Bca101_014396 [Brassica carinata]